MERLHTVGCGLVSRGGKNVPKSLKNSQNRVIFGSDSRLNNKVALSVKYQKINFLFEVWFCGMMYIEDTCDEL
jgi:hypothetical protein